MKIKRILVSVDGSATSLARLETGFNLAKSWDASVTAFYPITVEIPAVYSGGVHGGWYMGSELLESARTEAYQAAAEVRTACENLGRQCQMDLTWIEREGEVSTVTNIESRFYDLLLVGKPDPDNESQPGQSGLNSILLGSGKPCLVVPGTNPLFKQTPGKIIFAWDGGREASQALLQSMPLLVAAESVMVLSVYRHNESTDYVESSNRRIVEHLKEHGVPATSVLLDKKHQSTAQTLADYAQQSETELLVMGAYGHSRFREIILGGDTREMLKNATIPVLYAH